MVCVKAWPGWFPTLHLQEWESLKLPINHRHQSSLPGNFVIICTNPSMRPLVKQCLLSYHIHQFITIHSSPDTVVNEDNQHLRQKSREAKRKNKLNYTKTREFNSGMNQWKGITHSQEIADETERRHHGKDSKDHLTDLLWCCFIFTL